MRVAIDRETGEYDTFRRWEVVADENLCVPGYEYHFLDESQEPPVFVSQIPEGFAGPQSIHDPARADASSWLEKLPVIQEFRRKVLRRNYELTLKPDDTFRQVAFTGDQ